MTDDYEEVLSALIAERGGADKLSVSAIALLRQAAKLLVEDTADPARSAASISSLLALVPAPKVEREIDKLEVQFVSARDDLLDLDLDALDFEELMSLECILLKAIGGQPRRLEAALLLVKALDRIERERDRPIREYNGNDLDQRLKATIMNALGDIVGSTHVIHQLYGFGAMQARAETAERELEQARKRLGEAVQAFNGARGIQAADALDARRARAEAAAPIVRESNIIRINRMLGNDTRMDPFGNYTPLP